MILNMLVSHPKVDVLYNPNLDDSEHACKKSPHERLTSLFQWLHITIAADAEGGLDICDSSNYREL